MTKRLIMLGHKKPEYATHYERVDNFPPNVAEQAGLIPWLAGPGYPAGNPAGGFRKPDADEIRKQRIEDRLAGGEGDRA